jgi:hypothetical protein
MDDSRHRIDLSANMFSITSRRSSIPVFPTNRRTIYKEQLFIGDELLFGLRAEPDGIADAIPHLDGPRPTPAFLDAVSLDDLHAGVANPAWEVTLPLSMDGIGTGAILIFMIANGSFVTLVLLDAAVDDLPAVRHHPRFRHGECHEHDPD